MIADNTPVIVGVGQCVERIDAPDYAGASAADLAARAAVDAIAAVRTFDDRFPFVPAFGIPDKFPLAVARRLGIIPKYAALGPVGGDTPIALLGDMGARIAAGETIAALIVGGEAISTVRHLQKRRTVAPIVPQAVPVVRVDWHPSGPGRVLTYSIIYAGGQPVRAVVIGALADGRRFIANDADAETLAHCLGADPIGAAVMVSAAADGNRFAFT
jgi:hypothetical protein